MIGQETIVFSMLDEVKEVEDFFKEYGEYCQKFKIANRPYYANYNPKKYVELLLDDICDPTISLGNHGGINKSTQFLMEEGVQEYYAKRFAEQISMMFYKKISLYFQDRSFDEISKAQKDLLNRYDIMITFDNQ